MMPDAERCLYPACPHPARSGAVLVRLEVPPRRPGDGTTAAYLEGGVCEPHATTLYKRLRGLVPRAAWRTSPILPCPSGATS